jgi:hypothetical protein
VGDMIQFDAIQTKKGNWLMKNPRVVGEYSEDQGEAQGLSFQEAVALQVCMKVTAMSAGALGIRTIDDLTAAADQVFRWYLERLNNRDDQ